MNSRVQDTVFGVVLMILAGTWTWFVVQTIPPGFGDGEIGPRAFPLAFGVALLILAALLVAWPLFSRKVRSTEPDVVDTAATGNSNLHWLPALMVLVQIALYGFLLQKIGFLLATPVVVLLVMIVSLRVYSLPKLIGSALGLTVGCWLVFEKIMGIYLAKGTWFNLG